MKKMPNMSHTSLSYLHEIRRSKRAQTKQQRRAALQSRQRHRCRVPGGCGVDMCDRFHWRDLVHEYFHTDTAVVAHAQQVIHNLKPLRPFWIIHRGDIGYHLVLLRCANGGGGGVNMRPARPARRNLTGART